MQAIQFRGLPWSRQALEWLSAIAVASVLIGGVAHRPEVFRITAAAFALGLLILAATFVAGLVYFWRTRGFALSLGLLALAAIGSLGWAGALAAVAVSGWVVLLRNPVWLLVGTGGVCIAVSFGAAMYLVRAGDAGEVQRADT